ncbi:chloride channel protein [Pseudonocardia xinjiangensis]|uniref:chloride channel protein n=1 Tax=Pseudonocardia xinjiangensis TaxID=75289 RepID=UPI003D8DC5C5
MTTNAPAAGTRAYLRLVLFGAVIGAPAALLAASFLALVTTVQRWLWHGVPAALGQSTPPWYLVLGLPLVGAAIVAAGRKLLPGDGGHKPLAGMSTASLPLREIPGVAVAAFGTLVFGAVLGPEAPLIALGCAVGAVVARLGRLDAKQAGLLTTAGAFSAVSALFGGPLVASFLLVEGGVGMGAALIPALLPGLVAAAVGYLVFVGLGDWGGLGTTALTVPDLPPYPETTVLDLAVAVAVGVVVAVVIGAARRLATAVEVQSRGRIAVPLFAGALCVGALALAVRALGGDSQDLLFSGQSALPGLAAQTSLWTLVVLLVAKALAYAVCLGCGFRGGPIFPSIFLGIGVAMVPAILLGQSPTIAVAVGAAAGMVATTRLLFAPVLFATILVGTGSHDAVPGAVLAAAAAWLTLNAMGGSPTPNTTPAPAPTPDTAPKREQH